MNKNEPMGVKDKGLYLGINLKITYISLQGHFKTQYLILAS